MIKSVIRACALGLFAAALAGLPLQLAAQSTGQTNAATKPTAQEASKGAKKKSAHPFHGKLAAVDKTAMTIKVGQSIYQITSETKITKGGKPATLADGVVGEEAGGYVKPTADGKMAATSVRFGPKPESKGTGKKKDKTAD